MTQFEGHSAEIESIKNEMEALHAAGQDLIASYGKQTSEGAVAFSGNAANEVFAKNESVVQSENQNVEERSDRDTSQYSELADVVDTVNADVTAHVSNVDPHIQ